jgi:hypothetical protein
LPSIALCRLVGMRPEYAVRVNKIYRDGVVAVICSRRPLTRHDGSAVEAVRADRAGGAQIGVLRVAFGTSEPNGRGSASSNHPGSTSLIRQPSVLLGPRRLPVNVIILLSEGEILMRLQLLEGGADPPGVDLRVAGGGADDGGDVASRGGEELGGAEVSEAVGAPR